MAWDLKVFFAKQTLITKSKDIICDVFAFFIDFKKTFDRAKHQTLKQLSQWSGLDDRDMRLITNLYTEQKMISALTYCTLTSSPVLCIVHIAIRRRSLYLAYDFLQTPWRFWIEGVCFG